MKLKIRLSDILAEKFDIRFAEFEHLTFEKITVKQKQQLKKIGYFSNDYNLLGPNGKKLAKQVYDDWNKNK